MSQNVPDPVKIPIPIEIVNNLDIIEDIYCGKKYSIIFTKKNNLWISGNIREEKSSRI